MKDQQIGHYKILEKLGAGGMGEVWLAEDTRLDREVALKFLPHFAAQDENEKARFIQEAKAAARLSHANIAQIHEIDEEDGRLYIVMEYVSNGSLRDVLDEAKGKSLPLEKVLTWIQQTAEGLAEAHSQGIIHRDIKPDNLMLTEKGQVKITDFGLARLETATRLTASGSTLGTVNYMSPEQITGKDADHRSDLFSLGATFFELLTGQQAFSGQDANSTYYAILNSSVDPLVRYRKNIPERLEEMVSKLLETEVSLRYQSAADLAADIRKFVGTSERPAHYFPTVLRVRRFFKRLIPMLGWGIALFLLVILNLGRSDTIDLASSTYIPIATDSEIERKGSWSPDGSSIAYLKDIDGVCQVMVRRLDRFAPYPITSMPDGVSSVCRPIWSRDGTQLYFIADTSLWVTSTVVGGSSRLVLEGGIIAADLSPIEDAMICWGDGGLTVSQPVGAERIPYRPVPENIRGIDFSPVLLRFSPDGNNIGLGCWTAADQVSGNHLGFWVLPKVTESATEWVQPFSGQYPVSVSATFDWIDSKHVVLTGGGNTGRGLWFGDIRSGVLQRMTTGSVGEVEPAVTRDGSRILFSRLTTDYNLIEIPLDGSTPRRLLATSQSELSPSYADNRIAYLSNSTGQRIIWIRTLEAGTSQPVVFPSDIPGNNQNILLKPPVMLSPNGQSVAYIVECSGKPPAVWISPVEGGNPAPAFSESLFTSDSGTYNFSWSHDSRSIVARGFSHESPDAIWAVVQVGNPESARILPHGRQSSDEGRSPLWSPRGDWIAGMTENEITLVSPESLDTRTIAVPVTWAGRDVVLSWSLDGRKLYILSSKSDDSGIYALDIDSGQVEKVADLSPYINLGTNFLSTQFGCMHPNGRSVITSERVQESDLYILDGYLVPHR
ncbi:protein kinase [Gemmatimonadota bacterium]